jgi:NADPH-dependent curcumin reductase CurA
MKRPSNSLQKKLIYISNNWSICQDERSVTISHLSTLLSNSILVYKALLEKIMPDLISREIQLVSRPQGMPTAANFALVETKLELLKDEWVLVRNLYLSVDPYMRGRMNDRQSYVPPFELGKTMDGGAVGEVIESHAEKFKPGVGEASRNENLVTSNFGWREYFMATPQQLHLAALNGIDVYFDNVGGEMLEAALSALRVNGRIIACGGISGYNAQMPQPGPRNLFNITTKRLTMKGLIASDWLGHQAEFEREFEINKYQQIT